MSRCPVWIHPGTEREGKRCVLEVGHESEHKIELELEATIKRIEYASATGIFVRAKRDDLWDHFDVAELTQESFLAWLRADPARAERFVLQLLDYI